MFFTLWVLVLIVFHRTTHKYIDLPYLMFTTMITGLYVSTIHPCQYSFWLLNEKYTLKSWDRFIIVDMFFHIGAFIFITSIYRPVFHANMRFLLAAGLIGVYSLLIDPKNIYNLRKFELLSVITVITLLYVLLYSEK